MAELLIKAIDATMPDSALEAQQSFKRGHPIVVMPDGWQWGAAETLPLFVVLKLPGIDVSAVTQYVAPYLDTDGQTQIGPRLWRVLVDNLPTAVKNTLATTGQYSTSWPAIKAFIQNQRDGSAAT
jgi:hypothetical protein